MQQQGGNIAKNASFLYLRMLLIMGVTLFTSRIIIETLGMSDYGIYIIIGGIVAMVGFINGAMIASTQRYLSFDIGRKDTKKLKQTFNSALSIHLFIGIIIIVFGETIGLWYLSNKLVFPFERESAVQIVYQFSLFTLFINVIQVPYNSLILARERMHVYAYISILEVVLKLFVAYSLFKWGGDKLILLSFLTFVVSIIVIITYKLYCNRNFNESKYTFKLDFSYMKSILSFSSWNLVGAFSVLAKNQGVNLILNFFFGTIINAAFGIVIQVQSAVNQFVVSFQSALNPQIIQRFANGNLISSLRLIFLGAKLSYLVLLFLFVPIMVHTNFILGLWLGSNVPDSTEGFLRIILIALAIDSISGPLMTGIMATGEIKGYQLIVGGINLFTPIILYFLFIHGFDPVESLQIIIIFSILSLYIRLVFLKKHFDFTYKSFLITVVVPILLITISVIILCIGISKLFVVDSLLTLIIWYLCFLFIYIPILFFFGLGKSLQAQLFLRFQKILKKN